MNFCQEHWSQLREKIAERGLNHLVAKDGEMAMAQIADQLERAGDDETVTPVNFDPLMSAWSAIGTNTMDTIRRAGGNPLYLLSGETDPIEFEHFHPDLADQTRRRLEEAGAELVWPHCGLCYLGLAHELTCRHASCTLPRIDGYAWMLDRAADDARDKAIEMGLTERAA